MNVSRLYVAYIYINCLEEYLEEDLLKLEGVFLKKTIVYHTAGNDYIDLFSDEKYKLGIKNTYIGEMYINLNHGLIPINKYSDISFEKEDISKKRIIKKLSKAKLLNKKEDDK